MFTSTCEEATELVYQLLQVWCVQWLSVLYNIIMRAREYTFVSDSTLFFHSSIILTKVVTSWDHVFSLIYCEFLIREKACEW